jgi:hypothetical protein
MQTDVLSASTAATANIVPYRCRVKGIWLNPGAAGTGSVIFYDSAATGTSLTKITLNTTGVVDNYLPLPGEGVLFQYGVYAVLSSIDNVTIFYA